MHFSLVSVAAVCALFVGSSSADLFDCNENQNAFDPRAGHFVVHYTSIRDTSTGRPWIRVCLPGSDGVWDQSGTLETDCEKPSTIFSPGQTGAFSDFKVIDGNGCNSNSNNLNGASFTYNDKTVDLQSGDADCGPRDHGISCEFQF